MKENVFYLTLPSDSSMDIYGDNKISSFCVSLSNPLELDSNLWEVGIVELIYPNLFVNIRQGRNSIEETRYRNAREIRREIKLVPGYYSNVQKIVDHLNTTLKHSKSPDDYLYGANSENDDGVVDNIFEYNEILQKTVVNMHHGCSIKFGKSDIAKILGFTPNKVLIANKGTISEFPSLIKNGLNLLYIYSDIAKPHAVGDSNAPLLRVVPLRGEYGEHISHKFERPMFFPISKNNIDNIKLDLRSENGDLFPFLAGKVVVTLIFRRKKIYL